MKLKLIVLFLVACYAYGDDSAVQPGGADPGAYDGPGDGDYLDPDAPDNKHSWTDDVSSKYNGLLDANHRVVTSVANGVNSAVQFATGLGSGATQKVTNVAKGAIDFGSNVGNKALDKSEQIVDKVGDILGGPIGSGLKGLAGFAVGTAKATLQFGEEVGKGAIDMSNAVTQGAVGGIQSATASYKDAAIKAHQTMTDRLKAASSNLFSKFDG